MSRAQTGLDNGPNELVTENGWTNVTAVRVRRVEGNHHGPLRVFRDIRATQTIE